MTVRSNTCHVINVGSRPRRGEGNGNATVEGEDGNAIPNEPEQKFVTQNSLIELQCVHGPKNNSKTTVEHYWVLSFFTKTYKSGTWQSRTILFTYPTTLKRWQNTFFSTVNGEKKVSYKEVQLRKEGQQWGPTHVSA